MPITFEMSEHKFGPTTKLLYQRESPYRKLKDFDSKFLTSFPCKNVFPKAAICQIKPSKASFKSPLKLRHRQIRRVPIIELQNKQTEFPMKGIKRL